MPTKLILLHDMPDGIMLIVECPSGVRYENQVGGVVCWRGEEEGVLAPVDLSSSTIEAIQNCSYPQGKAGISPEIADTIDGLLATESGARMLKVDRERLDESWEAWIYVQIDAPATTARDFNDNYYGSVYGFGTARGVLTWPNSD